MILEQALHCPQPQASRAPLALADVIGEARRSQQGVPRRPYSARPRSASVRRCDLQGNPLTPPSQQQKARSVKLEAVESSTRSIPTPLR